MNALDLDLVQNIFDEALTRSPQEQAAFVKQACKGDSALQREVTELLKHHSLAATDYLEPTRHVEGNLQVGGNLHVGGIPPSASNGHDPLVGKSVGRFAITGVIASGGMGTVYEARQKNPDRTVAVKVLAAWSWSQSAKRRFVFESQILARLSHPHIAQIYESGTHDKRPYFVMEFIADALPITRYAEHKRLTVKQRLELMIHVCDAVQHGHQKGIIHRDLKPGNILVDGEGHVKVIDFGVARSTDSDVAVTTMRTDVGQLIGTLQYMSPEQCQADPLGLDVRSDVYSLGIVLYELLCEQMPYDVSKTTIAHAARVICEELPVRPSGFRRSLRGDIELILLKALEKDREQRYQSVADLGRDLQRFLSHEPIEAKPPTVWTRMTGWFRRHPIATTSLFAVLVALGIVGGSIAAVEYTRRTPWRVEVAHGNKEVHLIALNGAILHTWYTVAPAIGIGGKSMDAVVGGRETKLALILYSRDDGGPHRGELCAYDIGQREYDSPLWCDRIHNDDLPNDPTRTLREIEFHPCSVWPMDIYPEIDGKEILVQFAHDYSRRAIRVYSATGDRLHQTWHDGAVYAAHFLPLPNLLVLAALHDAHPWRERGHPDIVNEVRYGKPLVVLAFQPTRGDWNRMYLCTDGKTQCVEPAWYKCLLPVEETTNIGYIQLYLPPPHLADGSHVSLNLDYITTNNKPSANAGWTIDQFGNRVGDDFIKTDTYLLQEGKIPPIESFYLGPLPPIVKQN